MSMFNVSGGEVEEEVADMQGVRSSNLCKVDNL